ncbi:MAG: hypothetical protein ACTS77_00280 [Arsenophonus sp. NC-TX2-MAG3]
MRWISRTHGCDNIRTSYLVNERDAIARNGYLLQQTIQTGISNIEIKFLKL